MSYRCTQGARHRSAWVQASWAPTHCARVPRIGPGSDFAHARSSGRPGIGHSAPGISPSKANALCERANALEFEKVGVRASIASLAPKPLGVRELRNASHRANQFDLRKDRVPAQMGAPLSLEPTHIQATQVATYSRCTLNTRCGRAQTWHA